MADLRIDLASEFKGKKAFKEADKAVSGLDRAVGKLGKQFVGLFAAQKIYAFGKASFKAFVDDEAAARRLATTVDNLGLSFSQTKVTEFISNLERTSGVLDDSLRPAFQALLNTTGSLTKSQELLNNAIQISRASGIDLATVAQDLANGYVGITRGLKKYNTGLSQSELQTKSFNEILGVMLAKSAGAAEAYLTTTAYKMDVLTVATANAKEVIGQGLVEAFARVGGGSEAKDAAKAIENIAKAVSNVVIVLGTAIGAIEKFRKAYTNFLAGGDVNELMAGTPASTNRSASPAGTARRTAQQRAAEAAAAKRAKELAALTKKQITAQKSLTAEQKKQAALKKAGTVFDLEQIQIIAALKGKLSEEDRIRLQAQLAILNENEVLAASLTKQILMAQDSTGGLYKFFLAIGDMKIKNPFAFLDEWIIEFQKKLNALTFPKFDPNAPSDGGTKKNPNDPAYNPFGFPIGARGGIGSTSISPSVSSDLAIQDTFNAVMIDALAGGSFALEAGREFTQAAILALSSARYEAAAQAYGMGAGSQTIEIKVTGDGDLTNAIASSLQQQSLSSGNQTYINRRTGGFE